MTKASLFAASPTWAAVRRSERVWAAVDPDGVRHLGWHLTWCGINCSGHILNQLFDGWRNEQLFWGNVLDQDFEVCPDCVAAVVADNLQWA